MRSFNEIIETVLYEQASEYVVNFVADPVVKKFFDAYKQTFNGVDISADPNLENQLGLIVGGKRINARDIQVPFLPIIDVFGNIFDALKDTDFKDAGLTTKNAATLEQVLSIIAQGKPVNLTEIVNAGVKKLQTQQQTSSDPLDYETSNTRVNPARRTILSETDKASQIAVESLNNETIHTAIIKIVAKRIAVVDRLMSGKGVKKPFQTSLIRPLFSEYKKYSTGGKIFYNKIPGDFAKVVDQLSVTKLMNVAILSGEYYLSLLQQHITTTPQTQPSRTATPVPGSTVQDSIETFNELIDSLLTEYNPLPSHYQNIQVNPPQTTSQQQRTKATRPPQTRDPRTGRYVSSKTSQTQQEQPQQQTGTLTKQEYDQIATKIGNSQFPDYVQFLEKGESQYIPNVKYTLETISKDPSKQAQALYDAIRGIAYYTREGAGVQYRTQQAAGLMKSIAGFGGQGLYGGPSA